MKRFSCTLCNYSYDEKAGEELLHIPPNTPFSQVPKTFICPLCGMGKHAYQEVEQDVGKKT